MTMRNLLLMDGILLDFTLKADQVKQPAEVHIFCWLISWHAKELQCLTLALMAYPDQRAVSG